MKPLLYVTRTLPEETIDMLSAHFEVSGWESEETPVPREILEREIEKVDALYCLITDTIDAALLEKAKNLKVISTLSVGFNHIDIEAAKAKNITVTNTPGILTDTTADLTFALLMATARRIPEASEHLRNNEWRSWSLFSLTGRDIHHATIGIIGFGAIGQAVAKRAKGFDMNVLYYNRSRKYETEETLGASYQELDELLKKSDFVCILTPYSAETKDLITARELKLMKKTAVLINTARGGIVNEDDLYDALINGDIYAAGLDVFAEEPVAPDHKLLTLPNLVALPHIGSSTIDTRLGMCRLAAQNLIDFMQGKRSNIVNG